MVSKLMNSDGYSIVREIFERMEPVAALLRKLLAVKVGSALKQHQQ